MIEEDEHVRPLRLVSCIDQTVAGLVLAADEHFCSSGKQATKLVLNGRATLSRNQPRPPTEILDAVKEELFDLSAFGPVINSEGTINRFEMGVLNGGVSKNTAGGRALYWIHGKAGLKRKIREVHSCIEETADLVAQLDACRQRRRSAVNSWLTECKLTETEVIERGFERLATRRVRQVRGSRRDFEYKYVGIDWARFALSLDLVLGIENYTLWRCLEEGRILAVVAKNGAFTLHPPWLWKENSKLPDVASDWRFLFSRDLPKAWLPQSVRLKGEARKAALERIIKILEKRYLEAAPGHEAIVKDQVVSSLAGETGMSPNLVRQAWGLAKIPKWKKSGRRKKGQ